MVDLSVLFGDVLAGVHLLSLICRKWSIDLTVVVDYHDITFIIYIYILFLSRWFCGYLRNELLINDTFFFHYI